MSDLDPSELYQVIGEGLIDAAPADWVEAGVIYTSVGRVGDAEMYAILEDRERVYPALMGDALEALADLRVLFGQPGTGAWFTATARLVRGGSDHDRLRLRQRASI